MLLQRKDPPVDRRFISYSKHFEQVPEHVVQINRPPATYQLSEHTVILRYPEYAAPTWVCSTFDEMRATVKGIDGEAVVKPKSTYCGIGVTFFSDDTTDEEMLRFGKSGARR